MPDHDHDRDHLVLLLITARGLRDQGRGPVG
jgi:hypothetical protein